MVIEVVLWEGDVLLRVLWQPLEDELLQRPRQLELRDLRFVGQLTEDDGPAAILKIKNKINFVLEIQLLKKIASKLAKNDLLFVTRETVKFLPTTWFSLIKIT